MATVWDSGKLAGTVAALLLRVVTLEVLLSPGVVENHQNRHGLALAQALGGLAGARARVVALGTASG